MSPLRFFHAVPLQSPVMLAGLALVSAAEALQVLLAPGSGRDAVTTLLFVQLFSASVGFAIPARRGHYDALLTGGASRHAVVSGHLLMAIAPGVAAWILIGGVERAAGGTAIWSTGSVAALALVSVGGWAITAPLPRLSGGVIWLVVLLATFGWSAGWRQDILAVALGGGTVWTRAAVYLLCPLLLGGRALSRVDLIAALPALFVILGAGLVAWRWLTRLDVTLEAAQ
ncbi:MAG: hypothetical protein AB7I25_07745 [Vicinamibacterales bacterium]